MIKNSFIKLAFIFLSLTAGLDVSANCQLALDINGEGWNEEVILKMLSDKGYVPQSWSCHDCGYFLTVDSAKDEFWGKSVLHYYGRFGQKISTDYNVLAAVNDTSVGLHLKHATVLNQLFERIPQCK
jgi:hypothetical protein